MYSFQVISYPNQATLLLQYANNRLVDCQTYISEWAHHLVRTRMLKYVSLMVVSSLLVGGTLSVANAETPTAGRTGIDALSDIAPVELAQSSGLSAELLPASLANGINIDSHLSLQIQGVGDGKLIGQRDGIREYNSQLTDTHLMVQALPQGGGRVLAVLESVAAPSTITFEVSGPLGSILQPMSGGGVAILSAHHQIITTLEGPWARDANGQPVKTHYEVDGNHLRQVVQHHGHAYPVVMDPSWWRASRCAASIVWLIGSGVIAAGAIQSLGGPVMAAQLLVAAGGSRDWARAALGPAAGILGISAVEEHCL